MPCKIIPPTENCNSDIANMIGKFQTTIAGVEGGDITIAYPLVQKAVRIGENGADRDHPRMEYIENDKEEVVDLFPGIKIEDNYCFFERLSTMQIDPADGFARMRIGIVFYFGNTTQSLRTLVSKHMEAIRLMTEVGTIEIEERIQEVWREYGYNIKDFGQFQAPHVTFKAIVDVSFFNQCC